MIDRWWAPGGYLKSNERLDVGLPNLRGKLDADFTRSANTVTHFQLPLPLEICTAPQRNPALSRSPPVFYYTFLLSGNTLARQYRPVFKGIPSGVLSLQSREQQTCPHEFMAMLLIINNKVYSSRDTRIKPCSTGVGL